MTVEEFISALRRLALDWELEADATPPYEADKRRTLREKSAALSTLIEQIDPHCDCGRRWWELHSKTCVTRIW